MYASLADYNISAPHVLLCYVNDVTAGLFMPITFLIIWLIFAFSSYFIGKRTNGAGDFPASMVLASFVTLVIAILFRLLNCGTSPLTSDVTMAVCFVIFIISLFVLFGSRD